MSVAKDVFNTGVLNAYRMRMRICRPINNKKLIIHRRFGIETVLVATNGYFPVNMP
jgi:hypothetical protein